MMKKFLIHDNGGRPFCVKILDEIDKQKVNIYKLNKKDNKYSKLIKSYEPEKIFIGKSPKNKMTELSSGYGKKFEGNTILLYLGGNKYVFIGLLIYSFTTETPIIKFVSPVGNNDVPYPYAIDSEHNYYFLIEYGILKVQDSSYKKDPYYYYYDKLKGIAESENLDHMTIKKSKYWIKSHPDPKKNYDDLTKRLVHQYT